MWFVRARVLKLNKRHSDAFQVYSEAPQLQHLQPDTLAAVVKQRIGPRFMLNKVDPDQLKNYQDLIERPLYQLLKSD